MSEESAKPHLEHQKFAREREQYRETLRAIVKLDLAPEDYIHYFPAVAGELTLSRYLSLYEIYKMTVGIAGHIAEIGVGKGAVSILFAKLLRLFEPHTLTLVHAFDWFQGARPTAEEKYVAEGECRTPEELVRSLIELQQLEQVIHLHNLDASTELEDFVASNEHLMFKLVFLDCGLYDVVASSIKHLWPRIVPGGILVLDHFSHEFAPGEARAVRELLPHASFRQLAFGWMPVAYTIKS